MQASLLTSQRSGLRLTRETSLAVRDEERQLNSQTSLIPTPKGQNQVSALQRCPYHRGTEYMSFGISGTKRTVRNREMSVL